MYIYISNKTKSNITTIRPSACHKQLHLLWLSHSAFRCSVQIGIEFAPSWKTYRLSHAYHSFYLSACSTKKNRRPVVLCCHNLHDWENVSSRKLKRRSLLEQNGKMFQKEDECWDRIPTPVTMMRSRETDDPPSLILARRNYKVSLSSVFRAYKIEEMI